MARTSASVTTPASLRFRARVKSLSAAAIAARAARSAASKRTTAPNASAAATATSACARCSATRAASPARLADRSPASRPPPSQTSSWIVSDARWFVRASGRFSASIAKFASLKCRWLRSEPKTYTGWSPRVQDSVASTRGSKPALASVSRVSAARTSAAAMRASAEAERARAMASASESGVWADAPRADASATSAMASRVCRIIAGKMQTMATGDSGRRRGRTGQKAPRVTKAGGSHLSQVRDGDRPADIYESLVRAAVKGDERALETLLVRVQDLAYRFSVTVCGNADGADDVMQEALIRTYRRVGQVRDPGAFTSWLYRTVRNACLMSRRRRVNEPRYFESLDLPSSDEWPDRSIQVPDRSPGPEEVALNLARRRRLRAALKRLPPPYRAVVLLREVEGLSTREAAAALSLSEANVKQRLHRARVMLQANLSDLDVE